MVDTLAAIKGIAVVHMPNPQNYHDMHSFNEVMKTMHNFGSPIHHNHVMHTWHCSGEGHAHGNKHDWSADGDIHCTHPIGRDGKIDIHGGGHASGDWHGHGGHDWSGGIDIVVPM